MKSPFEIRGPIRTLFDIYTSIRPSLHIHVFRMAKLDSVSSQLHRQYRQTVDLFLLLPPPYFFQQSIIENSSSSIFSIYLKIDRGEKKGKRKKRYHSHLPLFIAFSFLLSLSHVRIESNRIESSRVESFGHREIDFDPSLPSIIRIPYNS